VNAPLGSRSRWGRIALLLLNLHPKPPATLALSEDVTLVSDTLNAPGTVQTIPVTGTETLPVPTATLTSSADPSPVGGAVKFTARVAGVSGEATPAGTVTFIAGKTSLGNVKLSDGVATVTTSALAAGTYTVTALYRGSAAYAQAGSNAIDEVIGTAAPGFKLSSSANPAPIGSPVTFKATVAGVPGGSTPTGKVTFYNGTSTLGTVALSGGVAAYTSISLPGGVNVISASYGGSALYDAASATPITETITGQRTGAPVFTPAGGTYPAGQNVTLTSTTAGAVFYYTTDGSAPSTSSTKYSGPITVSAGETLTAIATASGHVASSAASATYTIDGSPTAEAEPATGISASGATLNAIVNGNGLAASWFFRYGTSPATLTSVTAGTGIVASTANAPVSAQVTGLKAGQTYYYQVTIATAGGTASGAVLGFTTK